MIRSEMNDSKRADKQIGVRVTEDQKRRIEDAAREERRSVANFVRTIVFDYIEKKHDEPRPAHS